MTLVELVCAICILTIALCAFLQALVVGLRASLTERQATAATAAARRTLEGLRAQPFDELFVRFNASPLDDPPLGASPGAAFGVAGLPPLDDDPDGLPGEILFPTAGLAPGALQLREDLADAALGTPVDLNGDGSVDGLDHAGDYRVLPVLVRVRWKSPQGPAERRFVTHLMEL